MKKPKGIVRGAPSGLVISLLVHAAAFMLVGLRHMFIRSARYKNIRISTPE